MTDLSPIEPPPIAAAVQLLREGQLVAFPTETVYGLGGDATNDLAVSRIFAAKDRPRFNPLILHVPDVEAARRLVVLEGEARRLADLYWPGPLTLVLRRRPDCRASLLASAGLDTLALRVPAHPLAQALLRQFGRPLAGPSANRSGRLSPTTAQHVRNELGDRVSLILDGGPCRIGLESTIIDMTGERPILLRPGGLATEALAAVLGPLGEAPVLEGDAARPAPGMLTSHYAPSLPLRIDALERRPGEAFIAFGMPPDEVGTPEAQLSWSADTLEAASQLFATLRLLDRPDYSGIAVMPIPETGLGAAINDRLRRAAAPRG